MLTGRDKKKLKLSLGVGAIAEKIQSILIGRQQQQQQQGKIRISDEVEEEQIQEQSQYSVSKGGTKTLAELQENLVNEDKYPDLTHSLFYEEDDDDFYLGDPNASVTDLVRDSKEEGESFSLEDEIDHVADLFILKFHKNMRMQKLESFKRYQQLLERSA